MHGSLYRFFASAGLTLTPTILYQKYSLAVKELGNHEVVEYSLCQTEAWPNGLNCGPFELTYHKSMANNTASCVVMLANISKMEPFNDH